MRRAAAERAALPRAHRAGHRRADRHGLDRPRPRAHDPAAPSRTCALHAQCHSKESRRRMLTDDGKHLYVSLGRVPHADRAARAQDPRSRAGSSTRSCAWRAAACGRATCSRASSTSRWRSCRPARTAPRPARSRADLDIAKYITTAARASSPAACCWSTTWPTRASRCARSSTGCAACPSISELRSAVIWTKGVSTLHARLLRRVAADEPVDPPAVRGIRRPAARRAGEEVRRSDARSLKQEKGRAKPARSPSHIIGAQEGTRTPTELPAST